MGVLDSASFHLRTEAELGRIGRSGGFASVAMLGPVSSATAQLADALERVGEYLRRSVRNHDVVGMHEGAVGLLLPDTDANQASLAGTRLLTVARIAAGGAAGDWGCGFATVYGQVEGGAEALVQEAAVALRKSRPGQVEASDVLRGRPRVLVIDDDRVFCQGLAETVGELGWDAFPCSDVADALTRIRQDDYSGLIVDLVIPGSSGLQLLREALQNRPRLPAVLVSGADTSSDAVMEALSLGPVTFVRKPFRRNDLEGALRMFRALLPGASPGRVRSAR
jgi:CheY-like chemotaxis protein